LWTGDLLFVERTPSVDGDVPGWLDVIERLRDLRSSSVVPGHGKISANPGQSLDDEKRYLSVLLSDVRAAIKRGESMEQTIGAAGQSEKKNWVLFDTINRRNIALIYPALEWE
jgi:glyoxylase-like metal-dependent hydrolase (beta-lactamase superfamily II)